MKLRRWGLVVALFALPLLRTAAPAQAATAAPTGVRAGVGVVDATWNVGASAGQYASNRPGLEVDDWVESLSDFEAPHIDPHPLIEAPSDPNLHSTKRQPSYGVQSRLTTRAIVIQRANEAPVALLKSDNYLANDTLVRRVADLLKQRGSRLTHEHILYSVTHNHSSPYYSAPSPGVWLFQDVFDPRMFEYQARAMANAITKAERNLVPVRVGATTVQAGDDYRNAPGGAVADDGSPSGYPQRENDPGLVVMRFDDITKPTEPKPLAVWMNYGVHPESLDGYNLISGDYVAPLERFVGRELHAPLVFSQGDVGSSEPDGDLYSHQGYAQAERHARYLADKVAAAFHAIDTPQAQIPWMTDFPVAMFDGWVPGPVSHPYPAVSNCRTEPTLEGNPGLPVAGLPDCERPVGVSDDTTSDAFEKLKALGARIPENYDAPSIGLLEENARIHLQALRLGDILLASCSCEPQVDLVKNLESRTDNVEGNIYDGWDWSPYCDQQRDKSWRCPNPRLPQAKVFADRSLKVSDAAYRRMVAQVHNDARGWDDVKRAANANAEPADPSKIKGNFTKEEIQNLGTDGYKLTIGLGHTGDYNGYTVSYRMFMSFDHYRKALTSYGPHTADYMVTRLVRMAAALRGGVLPRGEPLGVAGVADEARQAALAKAVGQVSSAAYDGWLRALPADAGRAAVLTQPASISRFNAATVTWRGGNNSLGVPNVRVERRASSGEWVPYADQTSEVQTVLALPKGMQSVVTSRAGRQEWKWTATFEAANFAPASLGQTPTGTYRFVINGRRSVGGGRVESYALTSRSFDVRAWDGVVVRDLRVSRNEVSFVASSVYPRTYKSSISTIGDDRGNPVCKTCTFRAWASGAPIVRAAVTVTRANGKSFGVPAKLVDGRWVAKLSLKKGDLVSVERGDVVDARGELNGSVVAVDS